MNQVLCFRPAVPNCAMTTPRECSYESWRKEKEFALKKKQEEEKQKIKMLEEQCCRKKVDTEKVCKVLSLL